MKGGLLNSTADLDSASAPRTGAGGETASVAAAVCKS